MRKYFIILIIFLASSTSFGQVKSSATNIENQGAGIEISVVDPDEKDPDLEEGAGKVVETYIGKKVKSQFIEFNQKGTKSIFIRSLNAYFNSLITRRIYKI